MSDINDGNLNDGQQTDSNGSLNGDGTGQGGPQEPFLRVNERTVFNTQEDAIKSFGEAGNRISELTPWQKTAMEEFGLESPDDLRAVLAEFVELKSKTTGSDDADDDTSKKQDSDASDSQSGELTPEEQRAVETLTKLGFQRGDNPTVKELQQAIKELREDRMREQADRTESLVQAGRSHALNLFDNAKLPTEMREDAETFIKGFLERGGLDSKGNLVRNSNLARFYRGGSEQESVVKEAFEAYRRVIEYGKNSAAGDYQGRKDTAMKNSGAPTKKPGNDGANVGQGEGKTLTMKEAHDIAWEMFSKELKPE